MLEVPDWVLASWSWFGYGQWSLIYSCSKFWLSNLILEVQRISMSFIRGCWRILAGVCHLYLDLDMVTGIWYNHAPNFGFLSWFWRCKEDPCPLSPDLGICGMLEVPDWSLQSWSLIEYGFLIELEVPSKFQPSSTGQSQEISKSRSGSGLIRSGLVWLGLVSDQL